MNNLSTIIKEAENLFDEHFPIMDWEDGASIKEAQRMQDNVKSFLTEQITKAVNSALEATRLEEQPIVEIAGVKKGKVDFNEAVAEQAKKIERFKE